MSKESIASQCNLHGLEIRTHNSSHFKIVGGILPVNVYRSKKGFTIHVEGTSKGKKIKSAMEAVEAALTLPKPGQINKTKRSRHKSVKGRKYKSSKKCHWCGVEFNSINECTADHIIPISLGGSNGDHNIVLACHDCNSRRGDKLTLNDVLSIGRNKKLHEAYQIGLEEFFDFLSSFIGEYYSDGKLSKDANLMVLRNKIRLFGYDSDVNDSRLLQFLEIAKQYFETDNREIEVA